MPKMKTHSGTKKRFTITGTGKIKRFRTGAAHLLRKKTKKQKLMLSHATIVKKCDEKRVKKLLCI